MAETIESFVKKLQAEGVEAGKQAAEKIKSEAQAEAQQIVQKAKAEAEAIVKKAQQRAKDILAKGQEELALAARDSVLKLREALTRVLAGLLAARVKEELSESDFLRELIRDVVLTYARSDGLGEAPVQVKVSPQMQEKIGDWVLRELKRAADGAASVDLRGTLREAGFEYTVTGGVVEVTVDSVVETLQQLVGEALREKLAQAVNMTKA